MGEVVGGRGEEEEEEKNVLKSDSSDGHCKRLVLIMVAHWC